MAILSRRSTRFILFVIAVGKRLRTLVLVVSLFHLYAIEHVERWRQAPVREQGPDVLIPPHRHVIALAVNGAKALELVKQQHAWLAFHNGRARQHGRNGVARLAAGAVAEAVHLHFHKAVVKAQQLSEPTRQLRLARAGQTPEADDHGAIDQLGQQIPRAHRVDQSVDQIVQSEELGFQGVCGDIENALAKRHASAQLVVQRGGGEVAMVDRRCWLRGVRRLFSYGFQFHFYFFFLFVRSSP